MTTPTHTIDRKTASKLLKVSLRTLDRYVKQKDLCPQCRHGRIWFDQAEIDQFLSRQSRQSRHDSGDKVDSNVDVVPVEGVDNIDRVDKVSKKNGKSSGSHVYRRLYDELKQKMEEKQERLEAANYRVGQLEAQLKNTVPLLTYEEERSRSQKTQKELQKEIEQHKVELIEADKKIKEEKLNRIIIASVLFVVLALQPLLWFLLR